MTIADTILIVEGSSKGHPDVNARAFERARRRAADRCGADKVVTLRQPSKAELRQEIARLRDRLAGWIFIGHGYPEGVLLEDTAGSARPLLAPDRSNLLKPEEFGEYLEGTPVPSLGLFSCDQGGETGERWAAATRAEEILAFDGPAAIDDIADTYVERFVESMSCTREKPVCIR